MICREIREDSFFVYSEDMELVLSTFLVLNGREEWQPEFYTDAERSVWKKKYAVLFEMFEGMRQDNAILLLDACDVDTVCEFTLANFAKKLKEEIHGRLVTELLECEDRQAVCVLTKSEEGLQQLFESEEYRHIFTSLLSMRAFYRDYEIWIKEFVEFAEELRNEKFLATLSAHQEDVEDEWKKLLEKSEEKSALDISQMIMKKSFYNRGPFQQFVFIPAYMLANGAIRFYGENQILLYNPLKQEVERERLLMQLKTIADETRIDIIKLLNRMGPMCGKDIAKEMKLAQSTVSHHIEQLRNAGLLHEEQVSRARYYSVRKESKEDFMRLLNDIFR